MTFDKIKKLIERRHAGLKLVKHFSEIRFTSDDPAMRKIITASYLSSLPASSPIEQIVYHADKLMDLCPPSMFR